MCNGCIPANQLLYVPVIDTKLELRSMYEKYGSVRRYRFEILMNVAAGGLWFYFYHYENRFLKKMYFVSL